MIFLFCTSKMAPVKTLYIGDGREEANFSTVRFQAILQESALGFRLNETKRENFRQFAPDGSVRE